MAVRKPVRLPNQNRNPSTREWAGQWDTHARTHGHTYMEFYLAIRGSEVMSLAVKQVQLRVVLSKISQPEEKPMLHICSH